MLTKFSEFLDRFRSEAAENKNLKTYNDKKNGIFSIQKTTTAYILFVYKQQFRYDDDKFLKGDWLEFLMLYHLNNLGIDSELGIKVTSNREVENEIDLVFIKDYQLYLISCKSGRKNDPNKDLYEIETLRNVAGGTFGKAFLFTTKPLTERIRQRAKQLDINLINLSNLAELKF